MLQIAICDDEEEDLLNTQRLVKSVMDHFSVRYNIQTFDVGKELLEVSVLFDLIFLDIRLAGEDGIEIGKKIYWKNRNAKVIFQTHFREKCSDAVNKSHAFAFLSKPVEEELLKKQVEEFLWTRENRQDMWISFKHIEWVSSEEKVERQTIRLPVREIIYFEVIKSKKIIKTVTERGNFLYSGIFCELEERILPFGFGVCSRGIMVNFDKVQRMEKRELIMSNGVHLPLSQRRSKVFRESMSDFFCNSIGN